MDEPTLGIDPEGMRELLHHKRSVCKRRTYRSESIHQLQQIQQVCDRVGIYVEHVMWRYRQSWRRTSRKTARICWKSGVLCDDQILGMLAGQDGSWNCKEGRRFMITSKRISVRS